MGSGIDQALKSSSGRRHRVVVVGGGFAGLYLTRRLAFAAVEVTLIDRRNFHLFQPLLYQVATGGLSPANIAAPLRNVLRRQGNATVLMAEVAGFDVPARRVVLRDSTLDYDTLVVAAGAENHYFGHDNWAEVAPGLKTIEDATAIRARILAAFEEAERLTDPTAIRERLTFVVIGGGPTGVELAGAIAEIARDTLRKQFRRINPADAQIILLDAVDRPLVAYPSMLSSKAAASLSRLGVTLRLAARVEGIEAGRVTIRSGDREEVIPAATILWAAGVRASPLAKRLAEAAGAEVDRLGRILVADDCSVPGRPEVFALGDMAHCRGADGQPLPGTAPVAMQQGKYVARLIAARVAGRSVEPFRYRDRGSMATIGRSAAVAMLGSLRMWGLPAWLLWLFVHLLYIVTFENRVLVLVQWAWNYMTRNRAARLITEVPRNRPPSDP